MPHNLQVTPPRKTRLRRCVRNQVSEFIDRIGDGLANLSISPSRFLSPDSRPKKSTRSRVQNKTATTTTSNSKNTAKASEKTATKTKTNQKTQKSKAVQISENHESSENEGCDDSDYEPTMDGLSLNGADRIDEETEISVETVPVAEPAPSKSTAKVKRSKKCEKIANKSKNGPRDQMTGNEAVDSTKYSRKITLKRDTLTGKAESVQFSEKFESRPKIQDSKAYIKTEFLKKMKKNLNLDEAAELDIFYFILSEYLNPMFELAMKHTNERVKLVNKLKTENNKPVDMDELWTMWGLHLEFATNSGKNYNIRDTVRDNRGCMGRQRLEFLRANTVWLDPVDPDNKNPQKKYKKVIGIETIFNEISDFLIFLITFTILAPSRE